ncbi:hypothetical protein EDB81DRAFT_363014 [Dactylonectria macrodidyma]|uniref:Uncharacterized protein n=1 Tax=Dactylonectria macrodidyma TaxID=307937 RepID=A0A9P9D2A8_9HYPO|nr:hypothetical protein EDB81DRAFT_363014 [Dactylonectria macrodidyma]
MATRVILAALTHMVVSPQQTYALYGREAPSNLSEGCCIRDTENNCCLPQASPFALPSLYAIRGGHLSKTKSTASDTLTTPVPTLQCNFCC